MIRSTHCFPVKGRLHFSRILCFPPWKEISFAQWVKYLTRHQPFRYIKCILPPNVPSFQRRHSESTDHWSRCPPTPSSPSRTDTGFGAINFSSPAAPSGRGARKTPISKSSTPRQMQNITSTLHHIGTGGRTQSKLIQQGSQPLRAEG